MIKDYLDYGFYDYYCESRSVLKVFRYPLVEDHLHRYKWANNIVSGRVLDVACGSGWGTVQLAVSSSNKVTECLGIDINPPAFQNAATTSNTKVIFKEYDLMNPREDIGKFDSVVAFEIIEHFNSTNVKVFLENLKSFCRRNTKIYISTPNREAFSPLGYKWLPYHPVEYDFKDLKNLLKGSGFRVNKVYYQRPLIKILHKPISYLILFPTIFFKDKTLKNRFVKILFGIFTRFELFLGKSVFSTIIEGMSTNSIYSKYFIFEVTKK